MYCGFICFMLINKWRSILRLDLCRSCIYFFIIFVFVLVIYLTLRHRLSTKELLFCLTSIKKNPFSPLFSHTSNSSRFQQWINCFIVVTESQCMWFCSLKQLKFSRKQIGIAFSHYFSYLFLCIQVQPLPDYTCQTWAKIHFDLEMKLPHSDKDCQFQQTFCDGLL